MKWCLKLFLVCCFSLFALVVKANKLDKAYKALSVYDYFSAKYYFGKSIKKQPTPSCYGLAFIFSRKDNPFYNIDSSYVLIKKAESGFQKLSKKQRRKILKYKVDSIEILTLKSKIQNIAFAIASDSSSVDKWNLFIARYTDSPKLNEAIKNRNALAYKTALLKNSYQAIADFIAQYPNSLEIQQAERVYNELLYRSYTIDNTVQVYESFMLEFPSSPFIKDAEDSIYVLSVKEKKIENYIKFIEQFSYNHNVADAWMNIYNLSTSSYSYLEFINFEKQFPDFPFKEKLKEDMTYAQTRFLPYRNNSKWGFIDVSGKVAITAKFDWVDDFYEGMSVVSLNGKFGFIDKSGKLVIPCMYDEVEAFKNGLSIVKLNEKYAVINKLAAKIIDFNYDEIIEADKNLFAVKQNEKAYYIDVNGNRALNEFEEAGSFKRNRAAVQINAKKGFIDHSNKLVIEAIYDWVDDFNEDVTRVEIDEKYGLIDTAGKNILPCEYDKITEFYEGLARVVKDGKTGFVDKLGAIIIPIEYDYASEVTSGGSFINGLVKMQKGTKVGLMDKLGREVIPFDYDDIINSGGDYFAANKKGKWGFIDKKNKTIIPFMYELAYEFKNGLAKVKEKGTYGLIDIKNKTVVSFDYKDIPLVKYNVAYALFNNRFDLVSTDGLETIYIENIDSFKGEVFGMELLEKNNKLAWFNLETKQFVWKEEDFN